jgi:hypothetical protein
MMTDSLQFMILKKEYEQLWSPPAFAPEDLISKQYVWSLTLNVPTIWKITFTELEEQAGQGQKGLQ